ncbi:MAG: aldo/keto reductase [Proteobacteria bacterium]|nr:aldo/keto reductase [Pseudomonadota bacterium]
MSKLCTAGGERPTRVGLGGEGVLRTQGREGEAASVIIEALEQGLTYFDSAPAYAGSQSYYGSVWRERPEVRAGVFQASKSAGRTRDAALADLEQTLRIMGLDYLDLWQIHDLRTAGEFETVSGPGGALEAFVEARQSGRVRFIGVTGHHDPDLLTRAVEAWPVDAVLLPVNPAEACLGGFLDLTVAAARKRGAAVIGMKALGGSHYVSPEGGLTADRLLRFALAQPVDHLVVGCGLPVEVMELALAGRVPEPMSPAEREALVQTFRPRARRLAFYRGGA